MRRVLLASFAITAVMASSAFAEDTLERDARCAVMSALMTNSDNPEYKQAGMMSALYYLGRLDGRSSKQEVEAALKAQYRKLSAEIIAEEGPRCGEILEQRGDDLKAMNLGDR